MFLIYFLQRYKKIQLFLISHKKMITLQKKSFYDKKTGGNANDEAIFRD